MNLNEIDRIFREHEMSWNLLKGMEINVWDKCKNIAKCKGDTFFLCLFRKFQVSEQVKEVKKSWSMSSLQEKKSTN